jgi:hypothetical protein
MELFIFSSNIDIGMVLKDNHLEWVGLPDVKVFSNVRNFRVGPVAGEIKCGADGRPESLVARYRGLELFARSKLGENPPYFVIQDESIYFGPSYRHGFTGCEYDVNTLDRFTLGRAAVLIRVVGREFFHDLGIESISGVTNEKFAKAMEKHLGAKIAQLDEGDYSAIIDFRKPKVGL